MDDCTLLLAYCKLAGIFREAGAIYLLLSVFEIYIVQFLELLLFLRWRCTVLLFLSCIWSMGMRYIANKQKFSENFLRDSFPVQYFASEYHQAATGVKASLKARSRVERDIAIAIKSSEVLILST